MDLIRDYWHQGCNECTKTILSSSAQEVVSTPVPLFRQACGSFKLMLHHRAARTWIRQIAIYRCRKVLPDEGNPQYRASNSMLHPLVLETGTDLTAPAFRRIGPSGQGSGQGFERLLASRCPAPGFDCIKDAAAGAGAGLVRTGTYRNLPAPLASMTVIIPLQALMLSPYGWNQHNIFVAHARFGAAGQVFRRGGASLARRRSVKVGRQRRRFRRIPTLIDCHVHD